MIRLPPKTEAERVDIEVDFAARLGDDTIAQARVSSLTGSMSIEVKSVVGKVVAAWISGGDPGRYAVTSITIESVGGRVFEEVLECYCYRAHHL